MLIFSIRSIPNTHTTLHFVHHALRGSSNPSIAPASLDNFQLETHVSILGATLLLEGGGVSYYCYEHLRAKRLRLTSRRDDAFLDLNNHFELPYQQLTDDDPHTTGAFNLSTTSESLKRAKSADQALLPCNHLTLFNDDTNINFSAFRNSSSQIALPWPEVDLLLQNPGTANDILAGLPCSHISRQLLSHWQ
jgi:hypothetical protein